MTRPALAILLCAAALAAAAARAEPPSPDVVARGRSLTDAADCASCHTSDPAQPFAGGKRIDTPFGAVYSPNLTPDRETGIGAWSDDDFYRALHEGVSPSGARYYPAFPYPYFTKLTRDDVLAIRAYLATLRPIGHSTPPPELTWPLNHRVLMRGWNWLYFTSGTYQPNPAKSDQWNRGAYLVEGPGHCGACHTPKTFFGADRTDQTFGGSEISGWFAPRLDSAPRGGLASWSAADIAEYLQSGRNGKSHAGGPMAEVVVNSTSKLSDADAQAIAAYLKDMPVGVAEPVVTPPSPEQMASGKKIYQGACIACHEADGGGSPRVYPPLPGNANLQSADPLSTIRIILDGAHTVTTPRAPNTGSMPAYKNEMSDQAIADVATYIRNSWGNAAPAVLARKVTKARARR